MSKIKKSCAGIAYPSPASCLRNHLRFLLRQHEIVDHRLEEARGLAAGHRAMKVFRYASPHTEEGLSMYRVGWPGWKLAVRMGVTLLIRVEVFRDTEAGVYWAKSPDLDGLLAEGATVEELFQGIHDCADMLLEDVPHPVPKTMTVWSGEVVPV